MIFSKSKKKYTAAVIGTGRIGFLLGFDKKREQPASHTAALLANSRIQIIAGCDTDESVLSRWHRHVPNAHTFSSLEEFVIYYQNHPVPDIICIAVNEDAHVSVCSAVLQLHPRLIILEKPAARNCEEGAVLLELAEKAGVPVMVNHERRFARDYELAKKWLGKIGTVQSVHAALFSGLRVYCAEEEQSGLYSLLHDGTHLVDIVRFLFGWKLQNPTVTNIFRDEKNMVRNVQAHYETEKGASVTFSFSGRSKFFGFELDILGTEGRVQIGNGFARLYVRRESKLYSGFYSLFHDKRSAVPRKTQYFSRMIGHAVSFLDGSVSLAAALDDSLETLAVLEQIKAHLTRKI